MAIVAETVVHGVIMVAAEVTDAAPAAVVVVAVDAAAAVVVAADAAAVEIAAVGKT